MVIGNRVVNITIDEGGVPPHIKPLIASIADAIGKGNWGEVTHSTSVQDMEELEEAYEGLEEAYEGLAEALKASEEAVHGVRQAALDLAEEVEKFCKSTEVAEVSTVLEEVYEAVRVSPELLEQIEGVETSFAIAVHKLKTYVNGKLKDFED